MSVLNVDVGSTTSRCFSFTQIDPLEADVGSPYPSAYVYGNNNPLVFTDPSGKRAMAGSAGDETLAYDFAPVAFRVKKAKGGCLWRTTQNVKAYTSLTEKLDSNCQTRTTTSLKLSFYRSGVLTLNGGVKTHSASGRWQPSQSVSCSADCSGSWGIEVTLKFTSTTGKGQFAGVAGPCRSSSEGFIRDVECVFTELFTVNDDQKVGDVKVVRGLVGPSRY